MAACLRGRTVPQLRIIEILRASGDEGPAEEVPGSTQMRGYLCRALKPSLTAGLLRQCTAKGTKEGTKAPAPAAGHPSRYHPGEGPSPAESLSKRCHRVVAHTKGYRCIL